MDEGQRKQAAERFRVGKESPTKLAREYGVSRSTIYRLPKPETFQTKQLGVGEAVREYGVSGLTRFGGNVQEDYLQPWKSLDRMVPLVKEMLDYPIIAATMFAIEMAIRGATWNVTPAGSEKADEDAAAFLDTCMGDMSHTWDDHIAQALSFVPYGFAPFEVIYKKRLGPDKDPASAFDDGLLGWRKFAFRSQDTLTPGNEWLFDENGGVQGMNQSAPPDWQPKSIPIEKMLLYRTSAAKNNPQGRSMLRGAYLSWYMAKNFQEIEGIAGERLGNGLPVLYLGEGTRLSGANSDLDFAKQLVRDVRMDDQMGVVIPHPKMTADGKGVLFELVGPTGGEGVSYKDAIDRYNQQIAQVVLAQFIFFGLSERGTQALAVRTTDFFTQAISGWLEAMAETLNLFAIPRLFRLNAGEFGGITGFPRIAVGPIGQVDVQKLMQAINIAVNTQLLKPSPADEAHLRQLLELPEMEEAQESADQEAKDQAQEAVGQTPADTQQPEPDMTGNESFAANRGTGAQKLRTWERATNAYQADLGAQYRKWSQRLATDLENADTDDERDEVIAAALLALAALLKQLGRENIPGAIDLGLGDHSPTAALLREVAAQLQANEGYIDGSLIPDLQHRLDSALRDPEIVASGAVAFAGILAGLDARVQSYAGTMWATIQAAVGDVARQAAEAGEDGRVRWALDPTVENHCVDCLEYGDKEYESWDSLLGETGGRMPGSGVQCDGNCRCWLEIWNGQDWVRP